MYSLFTKLNTPLIGMSMKYIPFFFYVMSVLLCIVLYQLIWATHELHAVFNVVCRCCLATPAGGDQSLIQTASILPCTICRASAFITLIGNSNNIDCSLHFNIFHLNYSFGQLWCEMTGNLPMHLQPANLKFLYFHLRGSPFLSSEWVCVDKVIFVSLCTLKKKWNTLLGEPLWVNFNNLKCTVSFLLPSHYK